MLNVRSRTTSSLGLGQRGCPSGWFPGIVGFVLGSFFGPSVFGLLGFGKTAAEKQVQRLTTKRA